MKAIKDQLGNFNPRSREGSDNIAPTKFYVKLISIHAPVKGATGVTPRTTRIAEFQSTLP